MSRRALVVVVAVAVLAAIGAWLWMASPRSGDASPASAPTKDKTRVGTVEAPRVRAGARAAEAADDGVAPVASTTVDLSAVDRDLDLHGVVVQADGTPVADARLQAIATPWERAMTARADLRDLQVPGPVTRSAADGTFSLRLARGADVTLRVTADGFAAADLPHRQAGECVRVVLQPGVRVTIRVTGEAGEPVPGAAIRLLRHERQGDATFDRSGTSDDAGGCVFQDLPGGGPAYVECVAAGRAPVYFQPAEIPAAGESTIDVKLATGRVLRGRVVEGATGAAVAGARVGMAWVLAGAVETSADGTFALPGWTGKGFSDVHVLAKGFGRAARTVGVEEYLEFALERGFDATGRLVDARGEPVAGACVSAVASVRDGGTQRMSTSHTTSDAAGAFVVTDLVRALPHRLIVTAPGHARLLRPIPVPPADVAAHELGDVVLSAPRAIEGRVVGATGEPIARMPLELWGPDDRDYFHYGMNERRATDDLGRFRFPDLAPGGYQITTKQRGASEVVAHVQLPPDADLRDVRIVVDTGREVTVTVVDDTGSPVERAVVQAMGGEGMPAGAWTDATGALRLNVRGSGLTLRGWVASSDERPLLPASHPLGDDEREVRLVMRRGGRIGGVVLDPDGRPVVGAQLEVRPQDPSVGNAPADAAGRFALLVPAGGTYSVVFDGLTQSERGMKPTPWSARADDVAPGTTDLVLRCAVVAQDRTLTVRVETPDGSSAEGLQVHAFASNGGFSPSGPADAEGRARFSGLPAKEITVMAMSQRDWLGALPVRVTPEGQEVVVRLRRAAVVSGTVVGADGQAPARAYVRVYSGTTMHSGTQTGDDGTFRLLVPADEPGPFRVEAQSMIGTKPLTVRADDVRAGTTDLKLVLATK